MRALVYPAQGYISDNLISHLKKSGHEVLSWDAQEGQDGNTQGANKAWSAALPQATAVFHVLHEHQQHAKDTLMQLLQLAGAQGSTAAAAAAPVSFVGISTPLTWAATPVPPAPAPAQHVPAARPDTAELAEEAAAGGVAGSGVGVQGSTTAAAAAAGQTHPSSTMRGYLTAEDAPKRRPAASAVDTFHSEQLVLRCNRPGRLHTTVVCPGVLYGAGEADDQLHALWRAAWEGGAPLALLSKTTTSQCGSSGGASAGGGVCGANRLPTVHVRDLAAFCEAVVVQQEQAAALAGAGAAVQQGYQSHQQQQSQPQQPGRYLIAADAVLVTQRQLVEAVGQLLVHPDIRVTPTSLLSPPASPLLLLDLPLAASPWPQTTTTGQQQRVCGGSADAARASASATATCATGAGSCGGGLLSRLPQVAQELVEARNLCPLRVLIRGPPAAGKTHVGQRLAQLYGLLHINSASILAEIAHVDPDTQKAANAQLSSREGRLSHQMMAKLAQHLLLRHPTAIKQGWVMEGWPRSLGAALLATAMGPQAGNCTASGSSAGGAGGVDGSGGGGGGGKERGGRRDSMMGGGTSKDKPPRRTTAASSTGGGGGAASAAASGASRRSLGEDEVGAAAAGSAASVGAGASGGGVGVQAEGLLSLQSPELLPHVLIELDVCEDELQRRVKALMAAEAAAAAAVAAAAAAAAASNGKRGGAAGGSAAAAAAASKSGAASTTAGGGSNAAAPAAAALLTAPSGGCQGGASGLGAPSAATAPAAVQHNNLKDWGRRMEAYRQLLQEDAVDLAAKRAAVVAAYQAQLAAEAAATAAAGGEVSLAAPGARQAGRQPGDKGTAGTGTGGGGSKMSTPRHATRQSVVDAAQAALPSDVRLPEHGGFVAYFVDAGAKYVKLSNPFDSSIATAINNATAATAAATPSGSHYSHSTAANSVQHQQHQEQAPVSTATGASTSSSSNASCVVGLPPPLHSLEQQLAAQLGPPHNYCGFPAGFRVCLSSSSSSGSPSAAAPAGDEAASVAAAGTAAGGPAQQETAVQTSGEHVSPPVGAAAAAAAAAGGGGSSAAVQAGSSTAAAAAAAGLKGGQATALGEMGWPRPDMTLLKAEAEVLATEAAARTAARVSQAAAPLASSLVSSLLLPDLMAGLVQVALTRPDDPNQVIADALLAAAARTQAAYVDPYADPVYAVQLAKVEAKAAREAARAAAAAAKAAREAAAVTAAAGDA